jgi:hypothetical protein
MHTHKGRAAITTALALALSGCLGGTTETEGTVPVDGTWTYTGQQTTGIPASLQGAVVFVSASTLSYGGSLDVIESASGNQQRRITGAVSGRMATSTTLDFDVTLGTVQRHHVGSLVADTVTGTWFELGPTGAVSAGGSYRAVRAGQ